MFFGSNASEKLSTVTDGSINRITLLLQSEVYFFSQDDLAHRNAGEGYVAPPNELLRNVMFRTRYVRSSSCDARSSALSMAPPTPPLPGDFARSDQDTAEPRLLVPGLSSHPHGALHLRLVVVNQAPLFRGQQRTVPLRLGPAIGTAAVTPVTVETKQLLFVHTNVEIATARSSRGGMFL